MPARSLPAVLGLACLTLAACGGGSQSGETIQAATAATTTPASSAPAGGPAPAKLQGTWRLVSKGPEKGLRIVITDRHYRVVERLAHGDLVVNGDEIAFFNAQICGLQLPDGVGRYRWALRGRRLHFTLAGDEPCGGRAAVLADATYERLG
jgi:hypothetical protein